MKNYQKCKILFIKLSSYKCSFENNKITLDELDAIIEEPFNIENVYCENESTKKRLVRMMEGIQLN